MDPNNCIDRIVAYARTIYDFTVAEVKDTSYCRHKKKYGNSYFCYNDSCIEKYIKNKNNGR